MKRFVLLVTAPLCGALAVRAQSPGGFVSGQTLTANELNAAFSTKQDVAGIPPLFASSPPIGGTTPNSGIFSSLVSTGTIATVNTPCNGAADDTGAFTAAAAAILAKPLGGTLLIPDGDCMLSTQIAATVGGNQRLVIRSLGMHDARLHFTSAASAGFAITLANTSLWISNGPSFAMEDVTFVSDWSTTTSQTAVAVAAAATGALNRPSIPSVTVRNVNTISLHNSGGFAHLLTLTDIATQKTENLSMWASAGDTTANCVSVSATAPTSTGLRFDGIRQQAGGTALIVTDYIQGVYVTDMQTVNTQHSISWTNPLGYTGADNLIVDHSQLASVQNEITTNAVSHVQVLGSYLLSNNLGWNPISITGGVGHVIANDSFVQSHGGGDNTAPGVLLTNVSGATVSGNTFFGLTGSGADANVVLAGTTTQAIVAGNTMANGVIGFDSSATPAQNKFAANKIGNAAFVPYGNGSTPNTIIAGPSGQDASASTVDPAAINTLVGGTSETLTSLCTNSLVGGTGNTCNATQVAAFGQLHSATAKQNLVVGNAGAAPYIGCLTVAQDTNGFIGGNQRITCVWPQHTASASSFRATADGTGTIAPFNVFGLNALETGNPTGTIIANMSISIAMADFTTPANGGTWTLPIGQLANTGASTTTWSAGTPVALGTPFTVATSADIGTTGLNLTITPPSADAITWTVVIEATVTRAHS